MNNITIISVYNNEKLFQQMKKSVSMCSGLEHLSIQIIGINNVNNDFKSASEAYNNAINKSDSTEMYIFCHQDIVFLRNSIIDIYNLCMSDTNTLFGSAGVKNAKNNIGERVISRMSMFQDGWRYKSLAQGAVEDVFTLDECMIAANSCVFKSIQFDEINCDGWHLYAADLCMQCHILDIPVKVFDADIIHLSGGNADKAFYRCEKRLAKKYRKRFPIISYTFGWTYTDPIRYSLLHFYRKIRYRI